MKTICEEFPRARRVVRASSKVTHLADQVQRTLCGQAISSPLWSNGETDPLVICKTCAKAENGAERVKRYVK